MDEQIEFSNCNKQKLNFHDAMLDSNVSVFVNAAADRSFNIFNILLQLGMMNKLMVPDNCRYCRRCRHTAKHNWLVGNSMMYRSEVHYSKSKPMVLQPMVLQPMVRCTMMVQCTTVLDLVSRRHRSKQWRVQPIKKSSFNFTLHHQRSGLLTRKTFLSFVLSQR